MHLPLILLLRAPYVIAMPIPTRIPPSLPRPSRGFAREREFGRSANKSKPRWSCKGQTKNGNITFRTSCNKCVQILGISRGINLNEKLKDHCGGASKERGGQHDTDLVDMDVVVEGGREGALAGKSGDGDRSEGGERWRVKPRRNRE